MKNRVKVRINCDTFKKEDLRKLKDILFSIKGNANVSLEFFLNGDIRFLHVNDLRIDPAKTDVLLNNFSEGIFIEVSNEILS